MKLPIETGNPLFGLYLYPQAKHIMEEQQDKAWTAQEIPVDKDISDYRNKMSKEQYNMVSVTLQLFVEIEQTVGEVWEKIAHWFPHSEIEGCCAEISRMEKSVHAFFYQKMSDELNINPEDILKNQQTIQVLKSKLEFLKEITSNLPKDKPLALATVASIEQVLLFSNFAMLKSFQANGHNLITNTITGVEFVIQDETLHGDFAAYLFNTYMKESNMRESTREALKQDIHKLLKEVVAHEDSVIEYVFGTQESINDITKDQLKTFIRFRANETLKLLHYDPIFEIGKNPIKDWFYRGKASIVQHDFFNSGTSQYRRNWKVDNFSVLQFMEEPNE
jgi:ribonucleotide reductase beta subunit family protein with ferritin-like domain